MSKVLKIRVSDESYAALRERAQQEGKAVLAYCRGLILGDEADRLAALESRVVQLEEAVAQLSDSKLDQNVTHGDQLEELPAGACPHWVPACQVCSVCDDPGDQFEVEAMPVVGTCEHGIANLVTVCALCAARVSAEQPHDGKTIGTADPCVHGVPPGKTCAECLRIGWRSSDDY